MYFRIYTTGGIIGFLVLGSLIMALSFHLQVIQKGNDKGKRHILHNVKGRSKTAKLDLPRADHAS